MLCRGLYELLIPGVYIGGCFYVIPFMTDCRNAYYQVCTCQIMHIRWFMVSCGNYPVCLSISGGCTSTTPASPQSTATATNSVHSPPQSTAPPARLPSGWIPLTRDQFFLMSITCKGAGESPAVSWDGIPHGTKSLVLILDDPDAPNGRFTHWIVYNIPPESGELAQAQPNTKVLANGAQQGDTSAGSRGYYAPCPPIGASHRYMFTVVRG